MERNLKGTVEQKSEKTNAVKIDGIWYTLGDKVKTSYVKNGSAIFSVERTEEGQNDIVTFIQHVADDGITPFPTKTEEIGDEAGKMAALKFAGNIYQATGQEEDAKILAEQALEFITKGIWIKR
ncbi:MAG: hypothetical protein ACTSR3_05855 [Candidatus Helarchaeota archaeon]